MPRLRMVIPAMPKIDLSGIAALLRNLVAKFGIVLSVCFFVYLGLIMTFLIAAGVGSAVTGKFQKFWSMLMSV